MSVASRIADRSCARAIGFTHVFRRPGFEWDVGLHYIYDRVFLGGNRYDPLALRVFASS